MLRFKRPGGTSRGVLTTKDSWFVFLSRSDQTERAGIGECSIIPGLSPDNGPGFEAHLAQCCQAISRTGQVDPELLAGFPSIRFGMETALLDLEAEKEKVLFPSDFTAGTQSIPINGLIWMGTPEFMKQQITEKLAQGFDCLKLKIGALDFEQEVGLLKAIRKEYTPSEVELRVDANGAFRPSEALEKLKRLSEFSLHSIEQPIAPGQTDEMSRLCERSPLPIALDEELIGVDAENEGKKLLDAIRPQFIILKPSLLGGLEAAGSWIRLAEARGTGWWVTSALESNIGLNAIAQWTYTLGNPMHQGLGTGQLYTNNIRSPLTIRSGRLHYDPDSPWQADI